MTETHKSRHQSKLDFVESLIKEYFVAEMRSKCYPSRIDRRFWGKVLNGKKDRIKDICTDIGIPCLFEDKSLYNNYERLYYPLNDIPKLFENMQDEVSYFCKGCDVVLRGEDISGVGKILSYDIVAKIVTVESLPNRIEGELPSKLVTRIL